MSRVRFIVGLGNPGEEYRYTRHNFGFLVVEDLARRYGVSLKSNRSLKGNIGQGKIEGQDVMLFLPMTYMNNSGLALRALYEDKAFVFEDLLVVTDDFNLDFGQLRLRPFGSAGGHNGLKSLAEHLKTTEFARLRVGIGAVRHKTPEGIIDFVLSSFTKEERSHLDEIIGQAVECCVGWLTGGVKEAMSQFNKRKKNE